MKDYAGRWFVVPLNPEPWAVGPLSVIRAGNKTIPKIGPNRQLKEFQLAVKEQLDGVVPEKGEVEVRIFVWRRIEEYKTHQAKSARSHEADATNMQKAIEDAIQGCLITNDREVRKISTTVVEQSTNAISMIVIHVKPFVRFDFNSIPDFVWLDIEQQSTLPYHEEKVKPANPKRDAEIEAMF